MKKALILLLSIPLALLTIYILFNQLDARANPSAFTRQDIPAANFDRRNGFYILWALTEPPEVDIYGEKIRQKYRQLHHPTAPPEIYLNWDSAAYKRYYGYYGEKYRDINLNSRFYLPYELAAQVLAIKDKLQNLDPALKIFLDRYRRMMDAEIFEDFTRLNYDAPLPNLLAWLHAARLYTAVNMLTALEGDWQRGTANLLDQLDFGKRAIKGSRHLLINLVARTVTTLSIWSLADLLNQRECPGQVFNMVLKRTPPLEYEEYGSRNSLIYEYLSCIDQANRWPGETGKTGGFDKLAAPLLLQKNRTLNHIYQTIAETVTYEKTPPYRWNRQMPPWQNPTSGPLWWLKNPGGKRLLSLNISRPDHFQALVLKSYRLKALYEMLRISAELHLNYTPDQPVQKILNRLPTYRAKDPGSGKPYTWQEEKQILYSIGTDRRDDGGQPQHYATTGDFTLPVILYVRQAATIRPPFPAPPKG